MKSPVLAMVLWLAALQLPGLALAQARYVSDVLRIVLREQPREDAKMIRTLTSGVRLELLSTAPTGDFLKVRDPHGDSGWVLARFLMTEPAAKSALPEVKKQLAAAQAQAQETTATLTKLRSNRDATVATLSDRNRELEQTLQETQQQLDSLKARQDDALSRIYQQWFVVGAAVLGVGIFLGLLIPALTRSKTRSGWN